MYGLEEFHCLLLLGVLIVCAPEMLLHGQHSVLCLLGAKTFSEKLFEALSDQIESDEKNCFLPLYHFRNNLSFTCINTFSKRSTQEKFGSN